MNVGRFSPFYWSVYTLGFVCFRSLYRLGVAGRENIPPEGPCVILPKHQFWTDIPIVGLAAGRPLYFIAKQELFRYAGMAQFMRLLGGIPIDRTKPIKSLDTFRAVNAFLEKREFIVLFPEGTYYPYCMGDGKYRFIESILRTQGHKKWAGRQAIPFLPMGIHYGKNGLRPEVRVHIGAPLYSDGEGGGKEFTHRLLTEIARLSGLA